MNKYPECETCLNREYDPFQCDMCEEGSHYENEDSEEFMTLQDLIQMMAA